MNIFIIFITINYYCKKYQHLKSANTKKKKKKMIVKVIFKFLFFSTLYQETKCSDF